MSDVFPTNRCQKRMLAFDDTLPVLCDFGGRGAGRTTGAILIALRYLSTYERSRFFFIRQIEKGIRSTYEEALNIAHRLGIPVQANAQYLTIRLPNKSVLEFGVLEDLQYFDSRYRGQSAAGVVIDEMATYPDLSLPLRMLTCLRHATYPTRLLLLSNPGVSGPLIKKRLINPSLPLPFGTPFPAEFLGGKETVVLTSSYKDNEFLPADYVQNLKAASISEASFRRDALGNFDATESALHEITSAHFVNCNPPRSKDWAYRIGFDMGSVAPASGIWLAKAMRDTEHEGSFYPEDSFIAVWETTTATPESGYTKTSRVWSADEIAQALKDDAEHLNMRLPTVFADCAVQARAGVETVIAAFRKAGVSMYPAEKPSLKEGTAIINQFLRGAAPETNVISTMPLFRTAKALRTRAGLYLREGAVPALTVCLETACSDPRDPDKLPTSFPLKHHRDGLLYGIVGSPRSARTTTESGVI